MKLRQIISLLLITPTLALASKQDAAHTSKNSGEKMTQEIKKNHLSYHDVYAQMQNVQKYVESLGKPIEGIIAVTRGGLAPAGILSQFLGIKNIRVVCLESYSDDHAQGQLRVINDFQDQEKHWIVVDDLTDSGKTFKYLRQKFPRSTFVCPYAKPAGKSSVDYFAKKMPQGEWLVFPWEPDWRG